MPDPSLLRISCTRENENVPRDRFPSDGTMVKAGGQHSAFGVTYNHNASTCNQVTTFFSHTSTRLHVS